MEILEAFDLTETYQSAAQLTGADPKTVKHWVERRAQGRLDPEPRPKIVDPYLAKIEEWVENSKAKIRGDVAYRKLVAMGYTGSERTTRRAVQVAKDAYKAGNRRVYRPWIPEPGMWFQWDWGAGPVIDGQSTLLFCAWLAWSRFRVVIPTRDRTLPTVLACFDQALRRFGGVPTYALTDNEKTVTVDRVAGIPIRHPEIVAAGVHYGIQIRTCQPADPESKGGSEATVKIAKADLVPTDANLLDEYQSFAELEAACEQFCERVNSREHRITRRVPAEMLAEERARLHALPAEPYTAAFGETRVVDAVDHALWIGSLLGSPPADRAAGVGVGPRRRAGLRPRQPPRRPGGGPSSADHPGKLADQPRSLPRADQRSPLPQAPTYRRCRAGLPGDRPGCRELADRGCRLRCPAGANQDGPGG